MVKKLQKYAEKRKFKETPEPKAKIKSSKSKTIFVIQQHHASHMHFDFRLEVEGVLKSWAVPKGPSTDSNIKRLAVLTEDHPFDYATFEGIIPSGYGAGTVIVWDTGIYQNITEKNGKQLTMPEAFEHGHIKIILKGKKLKGIYSLMHFKDNDWLLVKGDDEYADGRRKPVVTAPQSVLSKKTIEALDKKYRKKKGSDE